MLANLPLCASLALLLGLVTRLTRLVVEDAILAPLRQKIAIHSVKGRDWDHEKGGWQKGTKLQCVTKFLSDVLSCSWCSSVWISAVAVLWYAAYGDTNAFNLVALAASLSFVASWALGREYQE